MARRVGLAARWPHAAALDSARQHGEPYLGESIVGRPQAGPRVELRGNLQPVEFQHERGCHRPRHCVVTFGVRPPAIGREAIAEAEPERSGWATAVNPGR